MDDIGSLFVFGLWCIVKIFESSPSGVPANVTDVAFVNHSKVLNDSIPVSTRVKYVWHPTPHPPLLATKAQWDAYYVPPPPPPSPEIHFQLPERSNVWVSMDGLMRPEPELEEPFYHPAVRMHGHVYDRIKVLNHRRKVMYYSWNSQFSVHANKDQYFLWISNTTHQEYTRTSPTRARLSRNETNSTDGNATRQENTTSVVQVVLSRNESNSTDSNATCRENTTSVVQVVLIRNESNSTDNNATGQENTTSVVQVVLNRNESNSTDSNTTHQEYTTYVEQVVWAWFRFLLNEILFRLAKTEKVQTAFMNVVYDRNWVHNHAYNATGDVYWEPYSIVGPLGGIYCLFKRNWMMWIISFTCPELASCLTLCMGVARVAPSIARGCRKRLTSGAPAVRDAPAEDAGCHSGQVPDEDKLFKEKLAKVRQMLAELNAKHAQPSEEKKSVRWADMSYKAK
jgi:hypothetical protein